MFSKVKAWLRSIIAEEVAKVSVSLTNERAEAIATLKNVENEIARSFDAKVAVFESRIKATLEAEHDAFVARLRAIREHIGNGEPSRWQADAETIAADKRKQLVK
jgi:recombinational DNA repair ATPase RecF